MEERDKSKKKKKKPRVIHALGNIKWGFTPRGGKVEAIDTLQTKWDREHDIKMKVINSVISKSYFNFIQWLIRKMPPLDPMNH